MLENTYAVLYCNEDGDIEVTHFNKKGILDKKVGDVESGFDDMGPYTVILMKLERNNAYHYAAELDDGMKNNLGYQVAADLLENYFDRLNEFFEHWDSRDSHNSNKVFDKLLNEMNNEADYDI